MKKVLKITGIVVGVIILGAVAMVMYVMAAFPKVAPAAAITVEATPERIARGKYLAHHVAGCIDCHSVRDWSKFAGPITPGTEGQGGDKFDEELAGMPGTIYAQNITPTYLSRYSDGELYRLITTGVTYDGRAMFPMMPYLAYGKMDPEDVRSIIAYIRTLAPKEGQYPAADLNFPMNIIVNTIPKEATPMSRPDPADTLKYGEYMFTIAGCSDCHTPMEKGTPIPGKHLAGGFEFRSPATGDIVRSANITQDHETGIGLWTEEVFVKRFITYRDSIWTNTSVKAGEFNTAMPWLLYAGMEEGDLRAIYRFLKTVPPVSNKVEKFTARQ
ncbi:MAG: c-type cytochrome [Bacteroidetes bacterium]|nr:c-type cytochrome [Bacteroidota bacterium]